MNERFVIIWRTKREKHAKEKSVKRFLIFQILTLDLKESEFSVSVSIAVVLYLLFFVSFQKKTFLVVE